MIDAPLCIGCGLLVLAALPLMLMVAARLILGRGDGGWD